MKRKAKVKMRKVRLKPIKLCDPDLCDHCLYVGEGDFLCDCHPHAEYVAMMTDWEPTEHYLHCQTGGAKP